LESSALGQVLPNIQRSIYSAVSPPIQEDTQNTLMPNIQALPKKQPAFKFIPTASFSSSRQPQLPVRTLIPSQPKSL
jgi:hypothetical protein